MAEPRSPADGMSGSSGRIRVRAMWCGAGKPGERGLPLVTSPARATDERCCPGLSSSYLNFAVTCSMCMQCQAADAGDHPPVGRLADGDFGVASGRLEVRELAAQQADLGFRVADYLSGTAARRAW